MLPLQKVRQNKMDHKICNNNTGFTLLEIVIAVAILAFISVFVAQSIRSGLQARTKIQREIDSTVSVREALNLISRDIQLAFNFRDINIELYNAALKESCDDPNKAPDAPPPPDSQPPAPQPAPGPPPPKKAKKLPKEKCIPKTQKTITHFIGESEKLNFSTRSNVRTQRNDPTSEQAEVGYELKDCKSRDKKRNSQASSKCLWRRFSPIIDDNPIEGGTSTALLENVKSLSFRYLGAGFENEWLKTWRSDGQGLTDEKMKNKFPLAVEITLVIEDRTLETPKDIGMTIVAPIKFPNNPENKPVAAPGVSTESEAQDDSGVGP